MFNLPSCLH